MLTKSTYRLIHACIQLCPYYIYMCLLLFTLSNSISVYIFYTLTHFFTMALIISFTCVETIYAGFNEGQSLSEKLSSTYFVMKKDDMPKQLIRHFVLEGALPLLLTLYFHTLGYLLFIFIDEGTRYLNQERKSFIELIMNGKLIEESKPNQEISN